MHKCKDLNQDALMPLMIINVNRGKFMREIYHVLEYVNGIIKNMFSLGILRSLIDYRVPVKL